MPRAPPRLATSRWAGIASGDGGRARTRERRRLGLDAWLLAARRGAPKTADRSSRLPTLPSTPSACGSTLPSAARCNRSTTTLSVLDARGGGERAAPSRRWLRGFSLSFGDLPAGALSEHGVGGGLRLAFLTRLGRSSESPTPSFTPARSPRRPSAVAAPTCRSGRAPRRPRRPHPRRRQRDAARARDRRRLGAAAWVAHRLWRATIGTASGSTCATSNSSTARSSTPRACRWR